MKSNVALIAAAAWLCSCAGTEVQRASSVDVSLADGRTIEIKSVNTLRQPNMARLTQWISGTRENTWKLDFEYNNQKVVWEGNNRAILINVSGGKLYLVSYFDYPTKPAFEFYEYEGNAWRQIRADEFPKRLAYQNLPEFWLASSSTPGAYVEKLDPDRKQFQISDTAYLWWIIEGNVLSTTYQQIDAEFLRSFMRKYMRD